MVHGTPNPFPEDEQGSTAEPESKTFELFLAVAQGRYEDIQRIATSKRIANSVFPIERRLDLPASRGKGPDLIVPPWVPALRIAVLFDDPAAVKSLLQGGANPYHRDNNGRTALHRAAGLGHGDALRAFLDSGVFVDPLSTLDYELFEDVKPCDKPRGRDHYYFETQSGETPLHDAAWHGSMDAAKCLISAGADVNAESTLGLTPLFYAVDACDPEMARFLVANGAEIDQKDRYGNTLSISLENATFRSKASKADIQALESLLLYGVGQARSN